jgi:hypothetical protein
MKLFSRKQLKPETRSFMIRYNERIGLAVDSRYHRGYTTVLASSEDEAKETFYRTHEYPMFAVLSVE